MTDRERLVELLKKAPLCNKDFDLQYSDGTIEKIADHILADGWMRPTVQMGQTVYSYCEEFCRVLKYRVENIHLSEETAQYEAFCYTGMEFTDVIDFDDDDIGKTVFLTREEAEKALKGGGEGCDKNV